jgi:D-arabinose 1-dehydrogenase-like Zn-dependent alcohol dehydrogenase
MKLLKDHNLTLLGTIRKNKKEIPPQLVQTKNKAVNTSILWFRKEMTMVSYVPKKGKVLLLVSTMHNDDKIDETTQHLRKPEIITTYNLTKGGVDTVDQLCATYDVSRN